MILLTLINWRKPQICAVYMHNNSVQAERYQCETKLQKFLPNQ